MKYRAKHGNIVCNWEIYVGGIYVARKHENCKLYE